MNRYIVSLVAFTALVGCCKSPKPQPPTPDPDGLICYYTYHGITSELRWSGTVDWDSYFLQPGGVGIFLATTAPAVDSLNYVEPLPDLLSINIQPYMLGDTIHLDEQSGWTISLRNDARHINYNISYEDYAYGYGEEGPTGGIPGRHRMFADMRGDSLFVHIELTFPDGETFKAEFKGRPVSVLVPVGTGTITAPGGEPLVVLDASCGLGYQDGWPCYYITASSARLVDGVEEKVGDLEFILPASLLGETVWLSQRGFLSGRTMWSFKYVNYQSGATFLANENSSGDDVDSGSVLLTVDTLNHLFHAAIEANLSGGRGVVSFQYMGIYFGS